MSLAKQVELKNKIIKKYNNSRQSQENLSVTNQTGDEFHAKSHEIRCYITEEKNSMNKPRNEQRRITLSNAEMQNLRAQGLCFFCEEKYTPKHKCKKEIHMITILNDDFMHQEEETNLEKYIEGELAALEVSLNSLNDKDSNRALTFKGMVGNREVIVLIDIGATHNFVSIDIVQRLNLQVNTTPNFQVITGTGDKVFNSSICTMVDVTFLELTMSESVLLLPLASVDIILGMKWLIKGRIITLNLEK